MNNQVKTSPDCNDAGIKEQLQKMRNGYYEISDYRKPWTENDLAQLSQLFYTGYGISETAVRLGRSEQATMSKIHEFKLYKSVYKKKQKAPQKKCRCKNCDSREWCANTGFCLKES